MSVDPKINAESFISPVSDEVTAVIKLLSNRYLESRRKRVFDLTLSVLGLAVLLVLLVPVTIAIKLNSRGPILYRQTRYGFTNRKFKVIKFRTMIHNAESNSGAVWKKAKDDRVTGVGQILRKLYIDELTQFVNVLVGEMSVVGPRPERPEIVEVIKKSYPEFDNRTIALPGVTGLAQVKFPYVSTIADSRKKLTYDELYIANASLSFDTWIVLRTLVRLIRWRGN